MDQQAPRGPYAVHWDLSEQDQYLCCVNALFSVSLLTWKNKNSSFSSLPPSLPFSILGSELSSHRSIFPVWRSLCVATMLLGEFGKQVRGVKPMLNMHFLKKYVQSLLECDFFFLFSCGCPSYKQLTLLVKYLLVKKNHIADVFIPKSLLYCLPWPPHTMRKSLWYRW